MLNLVIDDFEAMSETRFRIADDSLDEGLSTKPIVCSTNIIIGIAVVLLATLANAIWRKGGIVRCPLVLPVDKPNPVFSTAL